ncbi:MAG: helix-turn-helix transcriptional regulator [Dethiobacteria bacterium]|jgi:transcriptional regulator with XRE-family HTH domain|nr:helix-turn-helix transcriptional regulator [Bacillota bacterium]NMD33927.1 helix-turn-helix transcriptional regulator [Bacillota bacterium]HOB29727.1 helix-turn-helix transcriptional regulator [Bacillota bacterium]HPZ42302.1 helix-turn-helix transcriptional regulator [Bacillota bacterium]HQD53181.1 helix-turn-helix transcriptional regulator [Bacillota bacterium]
MPVKLGQRIRALRRLKRVTQQELATRLDLSVTMLSNIERGLKEPSPQLLERIARELDVPREELFIIKESADVPYITELPGRATGY